MINDIIDKIILECNYLCRLLKDENKNVNTDEMIILLNELYDILLKISHTLDDDIFEKGCFLDI